MTVLPPIPQLTEDEFAVFLAVVTEPWQWNDETLSEDLDFDVSQSVDRLRSVGLIAKPLQLQPTHLGVVAAGELGIDLHPYRGDPELREKIRKAYVNGCTRIADIAMWFGISRQSVYYHLTELRRRGELGI
jgi:hypothetical protein